MRDRRGNRQTFQSPIYPASPTERLRPIASLIPIRGADPLVESMTLRSPSRVSDGAIVMGIRLAIFLSFVSLIPGIVWLFSL
jgi:hypothetical protein